ncbi:beta-1,6-N-acetylglucosaminyltransferase [Streptococcus plurextorum]|uniref:beta-1,6-N-acetylglucosaminyltransferase n=1 Tax=Streptococcus plurextorum TaxID=456876 RepID=UPI00040A5D42|nr:beta-1,6-N-acetylglucosaminyltransferase [Streptococcus plurextorum]
MKRHAYLIIAHDKFEQLKYLISLLDDARNDIFIHVDKKANISDQTLEDLQNATKYSSVYLTPRLAVHWGDYSQIECELTLFETATQTDTYAMYHLISGVDLPLVSQDKIHDFFADKLDKIFITRNQVDFEKTKLYKLVEHYHLTTKISARDLSKPAQKLLRAYRILENKVQTALKIDRLNGHRAEWGLDSYSNWKSCNHQTLLTVLAERPFLEKHFRHSYIADEMYFPLVLKRSGLIGNIFHYQPSKDIPDEFQGNLRYINWWKGSPYTWTDSAEDLAQLDQGIALGHLFSRKFDLEKYPKVKDYIDQNVKH